MRLPPERGLIVQQPNCHREWESPDFGVGPTRWLANPARPAHLPLHIVASGGAVGLAGEPREGWRFSRPLRRLSRLSRLSCLVRVVCSSCFARNTAVPAPGVSGHVPPPRNTPLQPEFHKQAPQGEAGCIWEKMGKDSMKRISDLRLS